jgi:adenylate cyclase
VAGQRTRRYLDELRRRKVPRVALVYAAVGWLLTEVASTVFPALMLPGWSVRLVVILILLGFPLAIVLTWVFDITPAGIERTAELVDTDEGGTGSLAITRPGYQIQGPPTIDAAVASVAVLPFDDLSPGGEHAVLANGIATEIHSTLNKMHRIRVAPRRSSFHLAAGDDTVEGIAKALNVRYILSGSLMLDEDRLRVIAEFDDAIEGSQIWSRKYERGLDHVLSVQAEIAEAIVAAFGGERQRSEIQRAHMQPTENLDAWSLVQKARHYILNYSGRSLDEAQSLLLQGIELDPDYAAAHAALGSVLAERILNGFSDAPEEDCQRAIKAIQSAQSLASHDAFVLKMSGMVWAICGDPMQSVQSLRTSVELAPFDFGAWGYFGWPLLAHGTAEDLEEVHEIMDRLLDMASEHSGVPYWLLHKSGAYVCQDELERAVDFACQALDKHGELSWIWIHHANVLGLMGQFEDANRSAGRAAQVNNAMTPGHYSARVRAMGGSGETISKRTDGLVAAGLLGVS